MTESISQTPPLISCLCVTENRAAFMPWLLWNYDRQTWPNRELIIVDSSPAPFACEREDVRVIAAPAGMNIPAKRNLALRAAQGEIVTWFDDDDWQHPDKLAVMAEALADESVAYAGGQHGWFVNLYSGGCARHRGTSRQPVFNSAGFRRESVLPLRFPEKIRKASDTRWLQALRRRLPGQLALLEREDLFFWLCHEDNLSNPLEKRRFSKEIETLKVIVGEAWGDTDEALAGLRQRLTQPVRPLPRAWTEPPSQAEQPRVTVTIPYYQCRNGLRRAVESVLGQSYPQLRLVVVNDGDPNPPWDILADIDDPRLVRLDLEQNKGRYFADAVVVEATDDPYYLVQDADDWSDSRRLETLMARLQESNAIAAVSAARLFRPGNRQGRPYHYRRVQQPPSPRFEFRSAHHGLFRTDVLQALGGYYGGYKIGYDTLLMNLLQLVGPVAYEETPLYNRQIRRNSLTTSPATGMQSRKRKQVRRELGTVYAKAFHCYERYQAGALDQAGLVRSIAQICGQKLSTSDQQRLKRESQRLRALLAGKETFVESPQSDERLPALLDDPRLQWEVEWRPAHVTARQLAQRLMELRPRRILEVGSGNTTALLAAYATDSGASVVSLEHSPGFRRKTQRLLNMLGLADEVDLRQCDLREQTTGGVRFHWYDYTPDAPFDFVFVDGPPKKYGREGVLYGLLPALAPAAEIWLHDGLREHERSCVRRWQKDFEFEVNLEEDGKGVWVLRSRSVEAV